MNMKKIFLVAPAVLLAACASTPTGPGVMVLPGTGKSFDQFRFDDYECRQYAQGQVGGKTADQAANEAGIRSAAAGAAIGGLAGAALGGNSSGAVAGAALGTAGGALAGTGTGSSSAYSLQQRYDIAYQQCMYAKGNQIPMASRYGGTLPQRTQPSAPPPPPPPSAPRPPAG